MAISFSRPDPSSPAAVAEAAFNTARRGFDQQEVREFLRMVSAELGRLQERERFLERELRSAQANASGDGLSIDEETAARLLGEETARILTIARESAAATKTRAEDGAARLLRDATDEANRLRQDAELEAARRRSDAAADAEAELSMAKQQGREMVEEARAYRERVLAELARRRELARQQIDQLVAGRDRLVQVFERARLVASDVVAELAPLERPEELVDLSPTTGPVPVTVPTGRIADRSAVSDRPMPGEPQRLGDDEPDHPFIRDATGGHARPDVDDTVDEPADETATSPLETPAEIATGATSAPPSPLGVADPELTAAGPAEVIATPRIDDPDTAEAEADAETDAAEGEDDVTADVAHAAPGAGESEATASSDAAAGSPVPASNVLAFPAAVASTETDLDPHAEADAEAEADLDTTDPAGTAVEPDDDAAAADVDEIFARLRAGRPTTAGGATAAVVGEAPADAGATDDETSADAEPETPFAARDAVIVPLIVASARKLKRRLADEQNEILDALRRNEPVTTVEALVGGDDEHVTRYADAITADLAAAGQAGVEAIGGTEPIDLGPDGLLGPAREAIATELVSPLRERLTRAVDEADGDHDTIAKKVRGLYREWKSQRIDEELDDIVRGAYARAAYASLAPGTMVRWLVDPDGPASPDCEDNSLAEPVVVGDGFPTGHTNPPAHPGCRCLLVVVEG